MQCVCVGGGGGRGSCKRCSYAPVLLVMQCVCVGGGGDEVHARGVAMLLCCW